MLTSKAIIFIAAWVIFFAVDMFWIRVIMKNFYRSEMQTFFRFNMGASHQLLGFCVWGLLVFGLMYFVAPFSVNFYSTTLLGAAFGFVVYGVYDLTNYVVINNWSLKLLFADWAWGCFVNALMANVIFYLTIFYEKFIGL